MERGKLEIDGPVARILSEFDRADKRRISIRQLLTHTSGLPAWQPLYLATGGDSEAALNAIAAEPLQSEPGDRVCYSDLGFIALGFLLERIAGAPLAEIARRRLFDPLNLQHTCFNPAPALRTQVAASETGNAYEREKVGGLAGARDFKWREHVIWGEVHDGNAYFLGGVAGHAGLFSNARDTFRLADQFIAGRTELLAPETCVIFRTNMTQRLAEARSFGWQLAEAADSTAGPALSADSFGHLGFTGTSCWIEAARERVFILLTNRTHARQPPFAMINDVRRAFHTLASATLDAKSTQ